MLLTTVGGVIGLGATGSSQIDHSTQRRRILVTLSLAGLRESVVKCDV